MILSDIVSEKVTVNVSVLSISAMDLSLTELYLRNAWSIILKIK